MIEVENKINKNNLKSKMILQIHDELVIDTKNEEIEDIKQILKESMENVCKLNVPLKIEINIGNDLYEAK